MANDKEVLVPDIGDFDDVEIIEVLVAPGDQIKAEDSLVTLESDKATMEIPSPEAGSVKELKVKVGDKISQGDPILLLEPTADAPAPQSPPEDKAQEAVSPAPQPPEPAAAPRDEDSGPPPAPPPGAPPHPSPTRQIDETGFRKTHASPAIRRFARELGADLSRIKGTGKKGRVLKEDVQSFVKQALTGGGPPGAAAGGMGIPPLPEVDFSQFGETETQALNKIRKLTGANLHRAWLNVPHVTHHDEADVTELEAFRKSLKDETAKQGIRITALAFIMKAVVAALREFPDFNASLMPDGQSLVYKKYFHLGIAVDTPNGLVVPVFRDVDQKGVMDLATEMAEVSAKARDRKLTPKDMQGACMTISSLGGIGGTAFSPIVNAPEVAILGVTRARMTPMWNGQDFEPRLMLPLDLSYDHRVIDGAQAARFMAFLCSLLSDVRRLIL